MMRIKKISILALVTLFVMSFSLPLIANPATAMPYPGDGGGSPPSSNLWYNSIGYPGYYKVFLVCPLIDPLLGALDPVRASAIVFANFYGYQRSDGNYVASKVYSISLDLWFREGWLWWPFPPVATRGEVTYYRYDYSVVSNTRGTIFYTDSGDRYVYWTSYNYLGYGSQDLEPSHDLSAALPSVQYSETLTFTVHLHVKGNVVTTWPYPGGPFDWTLIGQITLYGH